MSVSLHLSRILVKIHAAGIVPGQVKPLPETLVPPSILVNFLLMHILGAGVARRWLSTWVPNTHVGHPDNLKISFLYTMYTYISKYIAYI